MKRGELLAEDLWPLVEKLSDEERIRLAYWALRVRPREETPIRKAI
jgi:hypothetical protein